MAKWTVMIFMGDDGVEGNKSLVDEADADILELEAVSQSPSLNIYVERHGARGSKRFRVGAPQLPTLLPSDPLAFANGIALTNFIDWAIKDSGHQPADYSMLLLWGHAYRFAIGHTQTAFGLDALDFGELAGVLSVFQEQKRQLWNLPVNSPPKLDIVAFDACSVATLEIAYQLSPYAEYLIASEIGMPLPGWPYKRVLERLAVSQGKLMGPAEFGSFAVRRFCEEYRSLDRSVSLSHLNLRQGPRLLFLTDQLAGALAIAMDGDDEEQRLTRELFMYAQTVEDDPFVDVAALCRLLARHSGSQDVRVAAGALGDALFSPAAPGGGASLTGDKKPFIVDYGSNSSEGAGLAGVSLYAPHVAPGHDFGEASPYYEKLLFARDTLWRDLVRALALPNQVCC